MDPILFWNNVANDANRVAHTAKAAADAGATGPCGSSRAYAIVHLAMHDTYFSIDKMMNYTTWLEDVPAVPVGADVDAAVAGAAVATLSALYPSQVSNFTVRLGEAGVATGGPGAESYAFGQAIAAKVIAARAGDPSLSGAGHSSSNDPGRHRHDPDADAASHGYHAPFYGAKSRCFAVAERYKLDEPYELASAEYLAALQEVRAKGIKPELTGTLPAGADPRTPTETAIGLFWAYDGALELGTPPRLYNQIVRTVAEHRGNDVAQNARLFALVNVAMGDAGILAWDDKYDYDLWRPVVGIREHDPSLGPAATPGGALDDDADTGWLPLGAPKTNETGKKNFTPPFPAYPSGHATFGAAALQSVRLFYDEACGYQPDNLIDGVGFVSEELNGVSRDNQGATRPYHERSFPDGGLWQMIEENGRSRVYLGVHWVFDAFAVNAEGQMDLEQNIGGVRLGLDIANDIATNHLPSASQAAGPRTP